MHDTGGAGDGPIRGREHVRGPGFVHLLGTEMNPCALVQTHHSSHHPRLQLPREYMNKLKLKNRVRLTLEDDHVKVWPGENGNGDAKQ